MRIDTSAPVQPAILIIDDTPANVSILADFLEDQGFRILTAQDGEEGLQRAELVQPDLILLDIMMPGIDGFETCKRLKANLATVNIPVIFMSALSDVSDKVTGLRAGGVDYITKPFQLEEVIARVRTHLALCSMRLQLAHQNEQLQREVEVRQRAENFSAEQGRILEMIAADRSLEDVFDRLVHLVEAQLPGMLGAVVLKDAESGRLRHYASKALAPGWVQGVETLGVGPNAASCGWALHQGVPVFVANALEDPLWESHRSLVQTHGIRAVWALPILSSEGEVLGALTLQSTEVREPRESQMPLVEMAVRVAGIAIERKNTQARIRHVAHHDMLTGLPNRLLFEDRLQQAIQYAKRYDRNVTVAFIDLDHFKLINDGLGHPSGDSLLKVMARRMTECVRKVDTVVRLGGDEFVIIFFDQPDEAGPVTATLRRVLEVVAEPVTVQNQELQMTCSIGLATYPADGEDSATLLMNADAAMYRAKELGRNNYQFYNADMNNQVHEKLALLEGLRNALARNEFRLVYQPKVDLNTGRIIGVEALIRWQHPQLGTVSPAKFIPLAEETGLIVPIGDWVLRTACLQNKAWQDAGLQPMSMSVNVSARQFKDADWIHRVEQTLNECGLDAHYLELELTESFIMQNVEQAIDTMYALQKIGIELSIDDFGTGYSSLSNLKRFPVTRLKIDQSFVHGMPADEDDNAIVRTIIALAQGMKLNVIAEGVETADQYSYLRDSGCDEMQGYYFSRPVAPQEIERLLASAERPQGFPEPN